MIIDIAVLLSIGQHRASGRRGRAELDGRALEMALRLGPGTRLHGVHAGNPEDPALTGYLGDNRASWRKHDAAALIEDGARLPELLVDVGTADPVLEQELRPELLEQACANAGIALTLRRQSGYDHSYYFISTFMADHIRWHAERLR